MEATANEGYEFTNWTKDGAVVSTERRYSFTVIGDETYMANFMSTSYHWDVNIYQYADNMSVTAIVEIEGEEQMSTGIEVGAFCGDECRGRERLTYYPQVNRYMMFMMVYGEEGDAIEFRLYDHRTGEESDKRCEYSTVFEANAMIGMPFEPQALNFTGVAVQESTFAPGWNWWSTYIEQEGIDGLLMLEEGLGGSCSIISSQSAYTTNYGEYGWYGSLGSIGNEEMYRLDITEPVSVTMEGVKAIASEHPITVYSGWTYMGYVESGSMSVEEALSGMEKTTGDVLKSQQGYTTYYDSYGWFGSLNTMTPGTGYMYKSNNSEPVTFTYPSGVSVREVMPNLTGEGKRWEADMRAYPTNMTVMAVVELSGAEIAEEGYELGVFSGGECRGSIELIYAEAMDRYVAFLTVTGEESEELRFALYDSRSGSEYRDCASRLVYETDAMIGGPEDPLKLSFGEKTDTKVTVYPNPVKSGEEVSIENVGEGMRVELINALGEVLYVSSSVNGSLRMLTPETSGVYMIRITDGANTQFKKLVVK